MGSIFYNESPRRQTAPDTTRCGGGRNYSKKEAATAATTGCPSRSGLAYLYSTHPPKKAPLSWRFLLHCAFGMGNGEGEMSDAKAYAGIPLRDDDRACGTRSLPSTSTHSRAPPIHETGWIWERECAFGWASSLKTCFLTRDVHQDP